MNDEFFTTITADELISEIPGYLNEFMVESFIRYLADTQDEIRVQIKKSAKDDENEVARIYRAVYVAAYNQGTDGEPWLAKYAKYKDKEASLSEFNLSFAVWLCSQCIDELRQGNLDEAFQRLGNAKLCIGMAIGLYSGAEQAILEKELEKKRTYDAIAAVRHAENRSMKKDAIQYYKDNHASFTSKDDAAMRIVEKIVPAKFATVRDWLKGVNPE